MGIETDIYEQGQEELFVAAGPHPPNPPSPKVGRRGASTGLTGRKRLQDRWETPPLPGLGEGAGGRGLSCLQQCEALMKMLVAGRLIIVAAVLFLIWPLAAAAEEPTPAPSVVVVEWTTESEVDMAGFNLYRSESPDGPYLKVNPALIPGSSDPLLGGKYVYTDTNVVAGRTYYYKLEDVELDGATTLHGPIEVMAEAAHPSIFSSLAAWWPLAVLVAVLVLSGVVALRWRGQRA